MLVFSDKLSQPGPDALIGDLMSLGAGLLWAATYVVIKRHEACRRQRGKAAALPARRRRRRGAAVCCPSPDRRSATSTRVATGALLFQAVYVVAVTYVMWFWLMRHYPASGLSSFTFLTPAFGVLFGGLLLGEPLGSRLSSWRWR